MNTEDCQVLFVAMTTPETLYKAWLSSEGHTAITGAEAQCEPTEGAAFTAWGGYIQGTNLTLSKPHHIIQSWRTLDFPEDAEDSRVEIVFSAMDVGTKVHIVHTQIPAGQGKKYEEGWVTHYIEPISTYYALQS